MDREMGERAGWAERRICERRVGGRLGSVSVERSNS